MATINIRTVGLEHVKQPYVNLIHFKGSKHDKRELMKLANIQSQIRELTKIKEECNDSWSANYYQRLINNLRLIVDLGYMRGGAASLPYGSTLYGTMVAAAEAITSHNVSNKPIVSSSSSGPVSGPKDDGGKEEERLRKEEERRRQEEERRRQEEERAQEGGREEEGGREA